MVDLRINPFKPNSPVSPGMFVGRDEELERLETHLLQTSAGYPSNFLITGERGIGKSSLLNYIKYVAQGKAPLSGGAEKTVKFLVIPTDIDQNTTTIGLIKKIELALRKELGKSEPARKFLQEAWAFLQRFEAAGVKVNGKEAPDTELLFEEFCYSLTETVERICNDSEGAGVFRTMYEGVLILIDEADRAAKDLQLGSFLKLLLERLEREECSRVMVGIAGLPDVRGTLIASHRSSLRIFDEVTLERLTTPEVDLVIDIALTEANRVNKRRTEITGSARKILGELSEGYPHFIQQFGHSAFTYDRDGRIDAEDVTQSAFGKNGALQKIGDRYYRDDYYNKIQEDSYRQVLGIMAGKLDGWITKAEIREKFRGGASTLDNAIKALRDKRIILSKEGERGVYRLQYKGFALWIKLYTGKYSDSDAQP
jgi:AAA ATPase-like protein